MKNAQNIYEIITSRISNLLEKSLSNLNYQTCWINTKNGFAINPFSKSVYDGINQLLLSIYILEENYTVNKWLTYKQAEEVKGKIKKGSKGFQIVYYNFTYTFNSKKLTRSEYDSLSSEEQKKVLVNSFLNYYTVFNVSQIENLPADYYILNDVDSKEFKNIEDMELLANNYISNSGISFANIGQNKAFYSPMMDKVVMPLRDQFKTIEAYYSVLFHEFTHSTGHTSRLNRKALTEFTELETSEEVYALEELVAELGTAFINAKFGIETQISNNSAYIKSWLFALKNDSKFFVRASGLAQKSTKYLFQISEKTQVAA